VDSTKATSISLVQHGTQGLTRIETFEPHFTYPIFEEEQIFGHKGLKLNIDFNACDMRPHFSTTAIKKYADVRGTEPEDVRATMAEYLPKGRSLPSDLYIPDAFLTCRDSRLPEEIRVRGGDPRHSCHLDTTRQTHRNDHQARRHV